LVQTEGSVGRDVRRPVALSSVARICAVDPDDLIAIVEAFRAPGRHFLTPSLPARIGPDTVIDITHESLIRQWHKLSDWVRAEFESGETYRHIEKTAQLWKKGKAGLLTMPYLGLALAWRRRERPHAAWAERYGGDFDLAMRFLNASVGRRVLRRRLSAAVIVLMVLGSGTFGLVQALAAKKSEKELRMAQDSVNRIKMDLRQARVYLKPNLAEELTDYHVPPQDSLKTDVGTSTPIAVPGATRVATKEIYDLVSSDPPPILIDALRSSHIGTIPGAVRIPFAGFPGDWSDQHQRRLKVRLDNLTNGNLDATLVFFCVGTQCWESYNAALRAIHAGYRNVYWYRGGLAAWKEAGLGFQFVFEQAQELKQKFAMPRAIAPRTRWALAASLNEAADALVELSATDGASDAAKAANDELRSLTGALGDNPDFLADLATSEMHLASFLETQDKLDDALKSRWEAKQIWDKLAQKQPQDINWRRASSEAARQIGSNLARQQKHTEALKAYREAQSIDQALAATHPDNAQLQIELWFDLVQIGMSLNVQKRHDDALARLREALAIAQTLATKEPSSDQWIEALSVTHGSMGEVLADSGRPVDALATYREELRIAALFLQQHPKSPRTKAELSRVAQTIGNLAYQLVLEGKFSSALEASELATALMPDVVWMQTNRAHALMFADRIEEARAIYFRYRGQKSQADKLWEDDIRNDFAELRKRGLSHPLMDEIEKQFSIPSATQARQTAEPSAAQTV